MDPPPLVAPTTRSTGPRPVIDPTGGTELARIVASIAHAARDAGGRALVVGAAVRDAVIAGRSGGTRTGSEDH